MTLRHYGRALAASHGSRAAVRELSPAPALADPDTVTPAHAALGHGLGNRRRVRPPSPSPPRAPTPIGDPLYVGDVVTVTVTYTNNTDSALTVFPVDSNLSGVLTHRSAPTAAGTTSPRTPPSPCTTATHTVTTGGRRGRDLYTQ